MRTCCNCVTIAVLYGRTQFGVSIHKANDHMTKDEKRLLISQAAKLTTLGAKVEHKRNRLKKLVERGVSYTAPEMLDALSRFEQADSEWKRLELEHLALRERLGTR